MTKKRNKKQKSSKRTKARLSQLYDESVSSLQSVKGEFKYKPGSVQSVVNKTKKANSKPFQQNIMANRREIVKSLVLASLILSLEVVLYFVWN
jgi:hypothetical protein